MKLEITAYGVERKAVA